MTAQESFKGSVLAVIDDLDKRKCSAVFCLWLASTSSVLAKHSGLQGIFSSSFPRLVSRGLFLCKGITLYLRASEILMADRFPLDRFHCWQLWLVSIKCIPHARVHFLAHRVRRKSSMTIFQDLTIKLKANHFGGRLLEGMFQGPEKVNQELLFFQNQVSLTSLPTWPFAICDQFAHSTSWVRRNSLMCIAANGTKNMWCFYTTRFRSSITSGYNNIGKDCQKLSKRCTCVPHWYIPCYFSPTFMMYYDGINQASHVKGLTSFYWRLLHQIFLWKQRKKKSTSPWTSCVQLKHKSEITIRGEISY